MIQQTSEERDLLAQLLSGVNRDDQPLIARMEPDGTLRVWGIQIGLSPAGETKVGLETGGEQRMVLLGFDGTALARLLTESGGALIASLYGFDGTALRRIRVNSTGQQFYEPFEDWKQVDPVLLTAADAILWNPGAVAGDTYLVEMFLYNLTAGAVTATVYVDVAAGGTAGNSEYLMNAESIPAKTRVPLPPVIIGGDDDIRGLAGAVDSVNIHFKAKRVART